MLKKRIASVFLLLPTLMALQSCAIPGIPATANYNGGFPSSTTETHTRTTIVTPPSYATVNIPPPSITQAPQYTIALPQANPPQYAVVQQQPSFQATVPVRVEAHSGVNTCD